MSQEIEAVLKTAGLSDNEAKVYLALLQMGPSSIWELSKQSGVKRPTCYFLLDELTARGIAQCHKDEKRVTYSVISPKRLAVIENRKHEKFLNLLPQLEGMASKAHSKPIVKFFDGPIGIMEVYNMTLELPKGSELLLLGTVEYKASYKDYIKKYVQVRAGKEIGVRAILPDTRENKLTALRDPLERRETRFLPRAKYDQKTEVNIFGDSIAYIAHSEIEPFATVVENSRLAHEEKNRFELLWEIASK